MKKLSIIIGMLLLTITEAGAQSSAGASASAVIVAPISIGTTASLVTDGVKFNIKSLAGNSVSSRRYSKTGRSTGLKRFLITKLTISGESSYMYDVSLSTPSITVINGGNMLVIDLTTSSTGRMLYAGTTTNVQTLELNALLKETGRQIPGRYTACAPAEITVNYN